MRSRALSAVLLALPILMWGCASSTGSTGSGGGTPAAKPAAEQEYLPAGMDPKDPLAPTMLMREGRALVGEGKVDEGLARYRAAVRIQPANPTIYNLIGQAELSRGDAVKALDAFTQAISLAPTYTDARNNRGAAYVALKQYSLAEADYLSALTDTTYANRAGVYYNLGALYVARGSLAAAEENLSRAATPAGPVEAYVLLGQVQERLEKPDQAEASYRTAIERAPERVDVAMMLARHLESTGRHDEAMRLYRRVIELGPGTREAAEARTRLGS
jgi:tetratricopeptide (TPR) repeat protein